MIRKIVSEFLSLPFKEIEYASQDYAFFIGVILAFIILAVIILAFLVRRRRSQKQFGYQVSRGYRRGPVRQLVFILPLLIAIVSAGGLVAALSEPFLKQIREESEIIKSRIRVDIRDSSTSMWEEFPGSEKSKAQVAVEGHAQLVKMRSGKNDRVSLWIFGSFPYMVEDFIVDDELYYFQVLNAPWITWSGDVYKWYEENPDAPWRGVTVDKYNITKNDGGGTNLALVLRAFIKQFDNDPESNKIDPATRRIVRKSVIIVSDGQPDAPVPQELRELKRRNVVVYLILINNLAGGQIPPLMNEIRATGGEYFDVKDANSLTRAYGAIDRMETADVEKKTLVFKVELFQQFILTSVVLLLLGITLGLIFEPFGVYP